MRKELSFTLAISFGILMCCCKSPKEKMYDACAYYSQHGYSIMSSTENFKDGDKLYLLLLKGDTVYLDTKFGINGETAKKILPNENGINYETLEVLFENGIIGKLHPCEFKNNDMQYAEIIFHDGEDRNGKDLFISYYGDDSRVYYYLDEKDALVTKTKCTEWEPTSFSHGETFTFADLYDDFEYRFGNFSLGDYPFLIEENYSTKDLSFMGFSNIRLKKTDYPCQRIKDRIGQNNLISEDDEYLYIPASWIGTSYMDIVKECIDFDINEKEAELDRERERAIMEEWQWEQEEAKNRIIENAIDFEDMQSEYFRNPIKAEKKYTIGEDILLKIRIDKLEYYSYSDYTYIMSWLGGFTIDAFLYSNDKSFEELDYPQIVWVKAKYNSRHEAWDNKVTYQFTDAQLLLWKKPGLFE